MTAAATTNGTVKATIRNVAPSVTPIPDQSLATGGTLNLGGTFVDPGADIWSGSVDWDYHPGDTDAVSLSAKSDHTFLLNHVYDTPGTYVVRVQVSDNDAASGATTFTVTVGDTTPPTVTAGQFVYQSGPRAVSITFSEDVTGGGSGGLALADALTVHNLTTNANVPTTQLWDPATKTATWTFASLPPDGNYTATLSAAGVSDLSGNAMAQNYVLNFYYLGGDANRDRAVDFNDLVKLAQNYNTAGGKTFADGDFNGDGNVDFSDLVILAQRYNTSLPAPAADVPQGSPALVAIPGAPMPSIAEALAAAQKQTTATPPPPPTTPTPSPKPVVTPPKPAPKPVVAPKPTPKPAPKVTAKPPALVASVFGTTRISAATTKKRDNVFDV